MGRIITMTLMMVFCAGSALCQKADTTNVDKINELKLEIRQLRAAIDSLRNQSGSSDGDDLDRLEERLERRAQDLEKKIDAVSRSVAPIAFNPKMVTAVNFAARPA